ncbi:ASCH domain-containing protein [Streptococcus pacificus]|uniref:ASCH domain-containing protein n=1 Tax=Streptococcus pacificus TaxID=2740577 RepID=A0ABS0ZKH6_9STRE|nr:ASCH domain-containing protein [Streptococcus pacificus]MBJ8326469.1 ASCH domain-containing protein [Streptococcus pacificus]
MTDNIKNYWEKFCTEKNIPKDTAYEAWAFGNSKEMADELADLVNKQIKTATTSAYELYENEDPLPQVGEYNIILNGSNEPVCVTQTKLVYIVPYYLVSPEHAWHEGEGDRSYDYWKKVHDRFFEQEYQKLGKTFYEQAPVVCEVFEKVSE